ncbi:MULTISPECIES: glycosyltransferase family 4 protein [Paraburkholderia]|uniref:Glycosyltransferase involved in cell wall biosynthesis n=1 Tax=Paraburkholderia bryophila TaxID=420952 RepID=A0A7Z0BC56_9BURK|nr:glycosyltransferase family 1 protein [Paraburkholderia bryophila]NYH27172.1 glycosyltransferase involved in cell wall biosynthesis [Paraburkholderia bryophila]
MKDRYVSLGQDVALHSETTSAATVVDRARKAANLPIKVAINGKFTSQRLTGVQRVAHELTSALSRLLPVYQRPMLLMPQDRRDEVVFAGVPRRVVRRFRGVLWEQLTLPFAASGTTLLSLCNVGPMLKRRQVLMIHDAAIFDLPEGYSAGFRLWYRFAFALLKRNVRHIVTVSAFSKARIVARMGISPDNISVVRNGVDHLDRISSDYSILERLNVTMDGFVLIVGSLAPGKNLARVLAAIALLEHVLGDVKFVIAGGNNVKIFGTEGDRAREPAKNIVWAGYLSDGELKALYENAACFVFPSLYEGFGLPPLEAMYCGCPVIASSEGALPEVCGDAALYCDASSVDDIAAKIAYLMGDVTRRHAMCLKGREHAKQFRWSDSATELLRVLREIE